MNIEDMHQFIKHLNYAIVLLDLVKNKASSPICTFLVTNKHYKPITKKKKRNKDNKRVRPNQAMARLKQTKPNKQTRPSTSQKCTLWSK